MLTNIGAIHAHYLDSPEAGERYYREALTIAEGIGYENLQLLFNHALNLVQLGLRDDARARWSWPRPRPCGRTTVCCGSGYAASVLA